MPRRRTTVARARAVRVGIALTAALACLGAAAYAANRPEGSGRQSAKAGANAPAQRVNFHRKVSEGRPPRPQLTTRTQATDVRAMVRFKFAAAGEGLRFQCQFDRGAWR